MEARTAPIEAGEGAALSLGELEMSASFLLRIAQLASYDAIFAHAPEMPLKLAEQTVLAVIENNPEARQGAIADLLHIKWSHMTKLVGGLEAKGLVERFVPPWDRRSVHLRLTSKGRLVVTELKPLMREFDAVSTAVLNEAEHRQLVALLRKVAGWPELAAPAAAGENT